MPLYEYQCDDCGRLFELIRKFSDPPLDKCPHCGGRVHKLFSSPAIQFKGSGFYITDYAKKDQSAPPSGDTKSDSPSQEKGETAAKGDAPEKGGKAAAGEKSEKTEKSEKRDRGDTSEKKESSPAPKPESPAPSKPPAKNST